MQQNITIGKQDFEKIRTENCFETTVYRIIQLLKHEFVKYSFLLESENMSSFQKAPYKKMASSMSQLDVYKIWRSMSVFCKF